MTSSSAARCDCNLLRSCVKELTVMRTFGPSVSLKWSLGRVKAEMISVNPPTNALLKLNVSRAVHRSVVNTTISGRDSRGYNPFLSFFTIDTARR